MPKRKPPIPPSEIIGKWHAALRCHPELAADLRACQAVLLAESVPSMGERARAREAWMSIPGADVRDLEAALSAVTGALQNESVGLLRIRFPQVPVRKLQRFVDVANQMPEQHRGSYSLVHRWLWLRYSRLWKQSPVGLLTLFSALGVAISSGAWSPVLPYILDSMNEPKISPHVFATVFANGFETKSPWRSSQPLHPKSGRNATASPLGPHDWSELAEMVDSDVPRHVTIALHVTDGATKEDARKALERALVYAQPLIRRLPGAHGQGTLPDFANTVTLYRLWRSWERQHKAADKVPTKDGFARAASDKTLPLWKRVVSRYDTAKLPARIAWLAGQAPEIIEDRLNKNIPLLRPAPEIPELPVFLDTPQ